MQIQQRNLFGQKSVTKCTKLQLEDIILSWRYTKSTLKLLLLFLFSKQVSLAALLWNLKAHTEVNACFACKCSLPQAAGFFSILFQLVPPCECNASQPTIKATGCEVYLCVVLYLVKNFYISHEKQVHYELA